MEVYHSPAALTAAGTRDRFNVDFGPYAALFADMLEVGGKAVAYVDHRAGDLVLPQPTAHGNTGDRESEQRIPIRWACLAEGGREPWLSPQGGR